MKKTVFTRTPEYDRECEKFQEITMNAYMVRTETIRFDHREYTCPLFRYNSCSNGQSCIYIGTHRSRSMVEQTTVDQNS